MKILSTERQSQPANPSERAARVEFLRRQVAEGTYRINTYALADALMRKLQKDPQRLVA